MEDMDKMEIPVVFATNDDYTLFCYTAIYSLIKHANIKNTYKIFVFVTNVSEDNCNLLESLSCGHAEVKCLNVSEYTDRVHLEKSIHLTIETYYRLFIPLILPEYEKVLYLDSDICVLADLEELYNVDINTYPIAAVLDVPCDSLKEHSLDIGGLDCQKTFNAGILLINNKVFEMQKIREKCLALLEEDYKRDKRKLIFADQDALNIVLYQNFKQIDKRWNCQPQYLWRLESIDEPLRSKYIAECDNAFIMHYAGDRKPWLYPELPKSDIFWETIKDIPVFFDIVQKIIGGLRKRTEQSVCFEAFQFPYSKIPYGSKIAIYAAGTVGQSFYSQLENTRYAECVLWVDRKAGIHYKEAEIESINKLKQCNYDYVVIAIDNKRAATLVKQDLLNMGIKEEKIVWDKYFENRNG